MLISSKNLIKNLCRFIHVLKKLSLIFPENYYYVTDCVKIFNDSNRDKGKSNWIW